MRSICHRFPNWQERPVSGAVQKSYDALGIEVKGGTFILNMDTLSCLAASLCGKWVEVSSENG